MSARAGPAGAKGGFSARLDRIFRTSLVLVPFGVLLNLALSWFATDHSVLRSLGDLPRGYLYLALALALVPWFTNAIRLLVWTRFIGFPVTFRETFRITLGAELASSVFPTSSGGEVFRWGMMVQRGITKGQAASIVSLGYLEDLLFFALALPTAVVVSNAWELPVLRMLGRQFRGRALLGVPVVIALLFALGFVWRMLLAGRLGVRPRRRGLRLTARFRRRLRRTWNDFRGVWRLVAERGKTRFLFTFLVTALQWSCRYSVVTALCWFLGARPDPVLFFLLQWVIFTAMLFVPTPGASGGAEAAFYLVYSALLPSGIIGIATAGWRLLTFYVQLALGSVIFTSMNVLEARGERRAPGKAVERGS
ncbi:MAG TPA: lysylphosphatidylglycerol synthase transmembrane domain-containing protein [Longimicrobium sp.]|nr:lysylphosphatidylglycerol synthase transmembrane domain-containing protein [Longimicrobium sp.]